MMKQETLDEISSIECIYSDQFTILELGKDKIDVLVSFSSLSSSSYHQYSKEEGCFEGKKTASGLTTMSVFITLDPEYPNTIPGFEIRELKGLSNSYKVELKHRLELEASKYIGSVMLFDLIHFLQEWLDSHQQGHNKTFLAGSHHQDKGNRILQAKNDDDDDESQHASSVVIRLGEGMEKEAQRPKGTPVTEATFFAWREAFEAEKATEVEKSKLLQTGTSLKPTGHQLFESDKTLISSDIHSAATLDEDDALSFSDMLKPDQDKDISNQ